MEVVANVDVLLTEILVRVPARPLVRFKCVSKHWLSLISDPEFCRRHTIQNPRPSISAVFPRISTALSFIPLDDLDHGRPRSNQGSANCNPLNLVSNLHDQFVILQSCNGLFLCCPSAVTSKPSYYVLNPTTNQFSTLTPPSSGKSCCILTQALAFDPSRSPHYMLLVFWSTNTSGSGFHIDIYSSETKTWRLVNSSFSFKAQLRYEGGVYCNGAVHWVGLDKQLCYYHIDDERAGHVDYKHFRASDSYFLQESHCGSHLHLIQIYFSCIEVLQMERDYSAWCLKYHISLARIFSPHLPRTKKNFAFLFLTPEETEEDESSSLLIHVPGQVISYNLKTEISRFILLTPRPGIDDSRLRVTRVNIRYMESLACV